MAATQFAVIYVAATLEVRMVFAPDDDSQLEDPAVNPFGCRQARIAAFSFDGYQALYAGAKAHAPHLAWAV